jgi:hypothetical protein
LITHLEVWGKQRGQPAEMGWLSLFLTRDCPAGRVWRWAMSEPRDWVCRQHIEEREKLVGELKAALAEVKTLTGLLPICSHCKKIRDDQGYWNQIELYLREHSNANFTHSICPECARKFYPEVFTRAGPSEGGQRSEIKG